MRIVFTGGGTGGHIYPALAMARQLKTTNPAAKILFIGTRNGLEAELVPRAGYEFAAISSQGLQRKLTGANLRALWAAGQGLKESNTVLSEFAPELVVGTGGYVCGPVVLMAHLKGIKTAIHEQNAWPGITNRLLARWVDLIMVNFPEALSRFPKSAKTAVTGLPIRPEILSVDRQTGAKHLGLDPAKRTLLVVGGSQGARSINQAMLRLLAHYASDKQLQIIQVTGTSGYAELRQDLANRGLALADNGNIRVVPYLYDMENALAIADLMICRAGAATLAEITAKGIPSILIPYPFASENHQEFNARALKDQGAACLILDRELNGDKLLSTVQELLAKPEQLVGMAAAAARLGRPQAAQDIVERLSHLVS